MRISTRRGITGTISAGRGQVAAQGRQAALATSVPVAQSSWWYNWPIMTVSIQQGSFGAGLAQTDATIREDHRRKNAILYTWFTPSTTNFNTWGTGMAHLRTGSFKPKLLMYYNVNDVPRGAASFVAVIRDLITHPTWGNTQRWYARRVNGDLVSGEFQPANFNLSNVAAGVAGLNSIGERIDQAWARYFDVRFNVSGFVDDYADGFMQDVFEMRLQNAQVDGGGSVVTDLDLNGDGIAEQRWAYGTTGNDQGRNVAVGNTMFATAMTARFGDKPVMCNTARFSSDYVSFPNPPPAGPPRPITTHPLYHTQDLNLQETHGNNIGLQATGSGISGTYTRFFNGNILEGARRVAIENAFLVRDVDADRVGLHAATVAHFVMHSRGATAQPNAVDRSLIRFWLALCLLMGRTASGINITANRACHLDEEHVFLGNPVSTQNLGVFNEATFGWTARSPNFTSGTAQFWWLECAQGLVVLRGDAPSTVGAVYLSSNLGPVSCPLPPGVWRSPNAATYVNPITGYAMRGEDTTLNNGAIRTSTVPLEWWQAQFFVRDSGVAPPVSTFTADSGWGVTGTATNGATITVARPAADLGTGPTVVGYIDTQGGTVGANVPAAQTVGTFEMTVGDLAGGADRPTFIAGPDGESWMNMLTAANQAVGDGTNRQSNLNGLADFTQFYFSMQMYTDGPTANLGSFNEKTLWLTRNGLVDGAGHDMFWCMDNVVSGNSGPGTFYFGGPTGADASVSNFNNGNDPRNIQNFRSYFIKPHTTAANGALYDAIHQHVNTNERMISTSTGLCTTWNSPGVTPAWNQFYLLGYLQHRGATPAMTYYMMKDVLFQTGPNCGKRFFWTDAATIAASREMFDCRPISWSANSVQLACPYRGASYVGKYLWYGNELTNIRVGRRV